MGKTTVMYMHSSKAISFVKPSELQQCFLCCIRCRCGTISCTWQNQDYAAALLSVCANSHSNIEGKGERTETE